MRWGDPERISQKTYESVNRRGSGSSGVYVIVHRSSRRKRLFFYLPEWRRNQHVETKHPLQGQGRRFRADLWMDEKITGRTLHVLRQQGVRFPENANPRKTAEFKAEYQRQLNQFRKERAMKKSANPASPIE